MGGEVKGRAEEERGGGGLVAGGVRGKRTAMWGPDVSWYH